MSAEVSAFLHACEGDAVTRLTNEKIPFFNAPIYLQNKTQIGKVDEIFGPINESVSSIVCLCVACCLYFVPFCFRFWSVTWFSCSICSYFQLKWWTALLQHHIHWEINSTLTQQSFCPFQDFSHSQSMFSPCPYFDENHSSRLGEGIYMVFCIDWICKLFKKFLCARNILLFFLELWIKSNIGISTSWLANSEDNR